APVQMRMGMSMLISDAAQITPEWLTERLAGQGILYRGAVAQINFTARSSQKGAFGNSASLEVAYAVDTIGPVPRHLFLKTSKLCQRPVTAIAIAHILEPEPDARVLIFGHCRGAWSAQSAGNVGEHLTLPALIMSCACTF